MLALALALRLVALGDADVWWDEGWSAYLARQDPLAIVQTSATTLHPPLHYLYLHYWLLIAGESEFALRFTSVAFGVLAVALVAHVGSRLIGWPGGALAALVLAAAPFQIAWPQAIRMYSPAVAFGLLAVDCLLLAWDGRRGAWAGYFVSALAGLFTLYAVGIFLLVANLGVAGPATLARRPRWRFVTRWVASNAAIGAVLVPWLLLYLRASRGGDAADPLPPLEYAKLVGSLLSVGASTDVDRYVPLALIVAVIAAVGLARGFERPGAGVLVGALLLGFPAALYLLSLPRGVPYAPRIEDRYLLQAQPAGALALAAGFLALWRLRAAAGVLVGGAVLLAGAWALPDYYWQRHSDGQLRALGSYVAATAGPDDLVVVNPDKDWPAYAYYLGSGVDLKGLPSGERMSPGLAAHWLEPWARAAPTVYLITPKEAASTDPESAVARWLAAHYREVASSSFGQTRLTIYGRAGDTAALEAAGDPPAIWRTGALTLPGAELAGFAYVPETWRSRDLLRVVALWSSTDRAAVDAELRLVLIDPQSGETAAESAWDGFVGQVPTTWEAGRSAATVAGLPIPEALPSGRYVLALEARPKGAASVARSVVEVVSVQQVREAAPPAGGPSRTLTADLGGLVRLLGYDLERTDLGPGDHLRLTLYWETLGPMSASYSVFVHVAGPDERIVLQADGIPGGGLAPTTTWQRSEVVTDHYDLAVPANQAPGEYRLLVGMYDPTTQQRLALDGTARSAGNDRVLLDTLTIH